MISIIVAMGSNRAIGIRGAMPWGRIEEDMKRFKGLTTGHPIIMGRKTWEAIGRTLPGRVNIVVSRTIIYPDREYIWLPSEGFAFASSLEIAVKIAKTKRGAGEIFVIGGGQIYNEAMSIAKKIYLTLIHKDFEADVFFPEIDLNIWEQTWSEDHFGSKDGQYDYSFLTFEKKKFVDLRSARGAYKEILGEIESRGECPFCGENFKYHEKPVLKQSDNWFITSSSWPYESAENHFLIIGKSHKENFSELSGEDFREVMELARWAVEDFGIKGGALLLRFGETEYTGASVIHLHFHLISPRKGSSVNFPIG